MGVPDESAAVFAYLAPRLRLLGDLEATRAHSFRIVNDCVRDVLRPKDAKWGLLEKTGGAQVQNRAVDIALYDLGDGRAQVVDIVANAEGTDNETPRAYWEIKDVRPSDQWRAPYGTVTIPPGGGVTVTTEQVRAMIEAAVRPWRQRVEELEATALRTGDTVALQSSSGMFLCAEGGGPNGAYQDFWLRSRTGIGGWESWKVHRGQ